MKARKKMQVKSKKIGRKTYFCIDNQNYSRGTDKVGYHLLPERGGAENA